MHLHKERMLRRDTEASLTWDHSLAPETLVRQSSENLRRVSTRQLGSAPSAAGTEHEGTRGAWPARSEQETLDPRHESEPTWTAEVTSIHKTLKK